MWLTSFQRGSTRRPHQVRSTKAYLRVESLEHRALMAVQLLGSFNGLHFTDSTRHAIPPDPNVAAGPKYVVNTVNTAIRISDKAGNILSTQELSSFFALLGDVHGLSDPQVSYDDQAHRFVVGVLDYPTDASGFVPTGGSRFDFAVSNDSDPRDGWSLQRYDMNDGVGGGAFDFADYPRMGMNADAYVISFNMFPDAINYDHVDVLSINKSSLSGIRTVVPGGAAHFTMAAATMHDAAPGDPMWFVDTTAESGGGFPGGGNQVQVVRMDGVLSATPTFSVTPITVTPYTVPFFAAQPGGIVQPNDARILNAEYRGGHLVAAQTVEGSTSDPMALLTHARWYDFNVSGASPILAQFGEIAPDDGHQVSTYFPAIAISPSKSYGMTYMQSSPTQYASMYVTAETD